jgi:hypothetical protein
MGDIEVLQYAISYDVPKLDLEVVAESVPEESKMLFVVDWVQAMLNVNPQERQSAKAIRTAFQENNVSNGIDSPKYRVLNYSEKKCQWKLKSGDGKGYKLDDLNVLT